MEWQQNNVVRARDHFKAGAKLSRGDPQYYSPLFDAWSRFEEEQGCHDAAVAIAAQFTSISAAEELQATRRRAEGRNRGFDSSVIASMNASVAKVR